MAANSPQEVAAGIGHGLSNGDLEGIMAMYEPNACLVLQSGQVLQGVAAIRESIAEFIALKPKMKAESRTVVQADDLAIVYARWSLSGTDIDSAAISIGA